MALEGVVTNVTAFGAFVDIGVHQDGLVHLSQLSDRFIRDPSEVVKAGDRIKVKVLDVDMARKRISLTARTQAAPVAPGPKPTVASPNRPGAPRQVASGRPPPSTGFAANPFANL
jgi:uncharacterized protein